MTLYDATEAARLLSEPPDLLTPKTAAPLLGISPRRVCALIEAGRLPAQNLGGAGRGIRWVLRREDVEAFKKVERPGGRPKKKKP